MTGRCPLANLTTRLFVLAIAIAMTFTSGCGQDDGLVTSATSKYEVADGDGSDVAAGGSESSPPGTVEAASGPSTTASPALTPAPNQVAPAKPSSQPPPSVNPTEPAGNTAADLARFITELQTKEPTGTSQAEAMADFQRTQQQIISTVDQLLKMDAPDDVKLAAAEAKIRSLTGMMQINVDGAADALLRFCDELRASQNQTLSNLGNNVGIQMRMYAFMTDLLRDPRTLVDDYRRQLGIQEKNQSLLDLGRQVALLLEQKGHSTSAQDVLHETSAAFAAVQDPQLIGNVQMLYEESDLIAVGVREKFAAVIKGEPGADSQFLEAVRQLLASDRRGAMTADFLLDEVAFMLESNSMGDLAGQLVAAIGPAYASHRDAEVAEKVQGKVERFGRRLALLGQPFVVDGIGLNGQPFDWSQYQGKVVLVDFWATWCRPCLDEIPNIKGIYERFRSQGFEVVGVNLDDDKANVESFFSVQQLPWPTVVSADPEARGMQTPLAMKCGVEFIPFVVLVGRDGRVAALNVRGMELGPKVAELLSAQEPAATGGG